MRSVLWMRQKLEYMGCAAGIIREAKATMVLATQAYTSILAALEKRYADVVIASKNIGKRESSKGPGAGPVADVLQLPESHQAVFRSVSASQVAKIRRHHPPLRKTFSQMSHRSDQSGRLPSEMVPRPAARLRRTPMVETEIIFTQSRSSES